jgi:hypothetical protein
MIRWLREVFGGGASRKAADAAVGRGMADVLAALDNVIDDDAALARIYAGFGTSVPGAAPGPEAGTAAGQGCARTGTPGSAVTPARTSGRAASRRRAVGRSVAVAAAALAAAAVALVAVVVPGAGPRGTDLTAYVVKRVDGALRAAGPGEIARMTVTSSAAAPGGKTVTTTAEEWSYGDQWRAVANSLAGHRVYDEGSGTASRYTLVSYPTRTWARGAGVGRPPAAAAGSRGCGSVVAALPQLFQAGLPGPSFAPSSLPVTVAGELRAAVSCGRLAVTGRQHVDGIETIELTGLRSGPVSETFWVSPGTYLPVRVVVRSAHGEPALKQTADITWLPPSRPNLVRLTVPVPTGFRHVPLTQALQSVSQHLGGTAAPGWAVGGKSG